MLLLDEPFGALDAQTRRSLHDFTLDVWQRTGTTILMVTHDVEEAVYLSQRVVVLSSHPGRIVEEIDVPFGGTRGPEVRTRPPLPRPARRDPGHARHARRRCVTAA